MNQKRLIAISLLLSTQMFIPSNVSQQAFAATAQTGSTPVTVLDSNGQPKSVGYTELDRIILEASTNYEHGRYKEAIPLFEQARQAGTTSDYQKAQVNLGLAESYRSEGRLKEAEALFKKAIAEAKEDDAKHLNKKYKANVKNSSDVIPYMMNDLAVLYLSESRFAEAEAMAKECIELGAKKVGPKSVLLALPYNALARTYFKWGKLSESKSTVKKTLELFTTPASKQNYLYAYTSFNLAQILDQEGKYKNAEELYKATLLGIESVFGFDHSHCAAILEAQGELYRKEGKYAEATKAFQRVRKIRLAAYSKTHADYGKVLLDLALVARDEGRYSRAQELCNQATSIITEALGKDNIDSAKCMITSASIFRYQGKYAEAEEQAQKAMAINEKLLTANNATYAHDMEELAQILADEGKDQEAKALLEKALKIDEATLGADHPDIASTTRSLAAIYLQEKDAARAQQLYEKALATTEKSYGPNNAEVLLTVRNLADVTSEQNKFQETETWLKKALSIDESLYSKKSPQYARDIDALANTYIKLNDKTKADPLLAEYATLKKALPGADSDSHYTEIKFGSHQLTDKSVSDKWAIVIGVSNFKDPSINLKYAAKDATDFRNFLVAHENFKADHVQLMTDANATKEKIISKLGDGWLGKVAKKDDLVLIYVSSHGSAAQDDVGVNFLVAYDTDKSKLVSTGLPMQWLTKIIQEQVHSSRVVVVLDVCHSGAAASTAKSADTADLDDDDQSDSATASKADSGGKGIARGQGINASELSLGNGQIVLCSSLANQISWESKNYPNSVFTKRLMEALQCNGIETTLKQAYEQLRASVGTEVLGDRGAVQTPDLANKNWTGGDPVLAVKAAGKAAETTGNKPGTSAAKPAGKSTARAHAKNENGAH
jgi:tetratricopeptide (TPR) repeat protein